MNANGYLTRLSLAAVLRDAEKTSVQSSLVTLRLRLNAHFAGTVLTGQSVKEHFAFGSYTRGTILPRSMDERSDIDYMVVFAEADATPQTYLNRLRRFAETKYPRSAIAQSAPTIVLSLNHIKFELVPAIEGFWGGLKIPDRSDGQQAWMDTEPNAFNEQLVEKNKSNDNLIKPLARVLKYWNACNGYPFESYKLEQKVVEHLPIGILLYGGNLWNRFMSFVEDIDTGWNDPTSKINAIERAKTLVSQIHQHQTRGEVDYAQRKLERLLPPVW